MVYSSCIEDLSLEAIISLRGNAGYYLNQNENPWTGTECMEKKVSLMELNMKF